MLPTERAGFAPLPGYRENGIFSVDILQFEETSSASLQARRIEHSIIARSRSSRQLAPTSQHTAELVGVQWLADDVRPGGFDTLNRFFVAPFPYQITKQCA